VQCTCRGHFIYFRSQVTSVSLSGHAHHMMNFHQKHRARIFLLSPLHYSTSQLPPVYVEATCNPFVSRSGPVTLQTDRVHVPYEQTVALRSYHQFRLIQAEALVHGNIYCDDSSSGLCSYTFVSNTVCMYYHQVKQQHIIVLFLNRKIRQFILWRFVCYIPTLQL
jgi:hypothetical protein